MSKPFSVRQAENGMHVILVPRSSVEAITVQFFYRAGSRYETPETNGLAHFTEHMVFKGGEKFPTFKDVNNAVNQVGGYFNAYTSEEVTAFYVKVGADQTKMALDVLSDILARPLYEQDELDRERGVIVEEINMYEDDPSSQLPVLLDATLYPDHPLGRPILGPKENIKSFPRDFFTEYTKTYLTPDRCVLVLSGKTDDVTDDMIDEFVKRFAGKSDKKPEPAKASQTKPSLNVKHRKTEQTHLGVALRGPSYKEKTKSVQTEVLAQILGGNTSSRLFTEVRERQGLAYSVHSSLESHEDVGTLNVYAGVTNEKADKALKAILHELKRLRDGDVTEDEVKIGKESLKGMRALRWEDSAALGTLYGLQQLLLGELKTQHKLLEEIEAVTRDQVIAMAKELVQDSKLNVAVLGPQKEAQFKELMTLE